MKGRILYQPNGKAGEYAAWAANLFVGCSNMCDYCYCKKGILAKGMGQDAPQLKTAFKTVEDAVDRFKVELVRNIDKVRNQGGVFFSFSTDPCLPETWGATCECAFFAMSNDVPVTILTKCADWVESDKAKILFNAASKAKEGGKNLLCIGFTLTGHDELEPNAAKNEARIDAMRHVHGMGIKTFASIEPIVALDSSFRMIDQSRHCCDLFRIGLMSGAKSKTNPDALEQFFDKVIDLCDEHGSKVYFKQSFRDALQFKNIKDMSSSIVDADFNIFNP